MKRLTQIFQALLGVAALICTSLIAFGRLAWRTIRNWWKKRSKRVRRVIAATLILVLVVVAYVYYDSVYGRWYWKDSYLSKTVELHGFQDYKVRVYNHSTGKYTTPKLDWVSDAPENDSLAVYAVSKKRGFINVNSGRIIIDAAKNDYSKAWVFSEGLAAVMKEGKIGFINAQNEVVIPFQFDYSDKCRMWDFGYLFHDGYCIMTNKDGDLGLIDRNGKWVVEPAYDEVWVPNQHGHRVVIKEGKYGILNTDGSTHYPAEYTYLDEISDGYVLTRDGRKWQVDIEGNIVNPFVFDGTRHLYNSYENEAYYEEPLDDYMVYYVGDYEGILNLHTGQPVTPAIYKHVNILSDSWFEVQFPESCVWCLLDMNGNMVSEK